MLDAFFFCYPDRYESELNHMLKYTAGTSLHVHTVTCRLCGYTYERAHSWVDMGSYYQCNVCQMTSTSIPGVLFSTAAYKLKDGEAIMIDEDTVLCCIDGEYYLVKATTETEAITSLINREVKE